ncbi:hypothetical protein BH23ACT12_BH23ACT12_06150 [soil metagenome]
MTRIRTATPKTLFERPLVTRRWMTGLVLCLAAAGCARNAGRVIDESPLPTLSPSPSASPSPTESALPVTLEGPVNNKAPADLTGMGAAATLEIVMADFAFNPTFVKLAPGANLSLKLTNPGGLADHTFTLDALGVDRQLKPGERADLVVQLPASGAFRFYCRLHVEKGMQGAFYFAEGDPVSTVSIPPAPTPGSPRSGSAGAATLRSTAPAPAPAPPAKRNPGDLEIPDLDINNEDDEGNLQGADGRDGSLGQQGVRGERGAEGEEGED